MKMKFLVFILISSLIFYGYCKQDEGLEETEGSEEKEGTDGSSEEQEESPQQMEYYKYLVKRLKQSALSEKNKRNFVPTIYEIPGPFEPLPGRTHNGDYWPVFPFSNQYSGGVDLDPSISRHIGGDLNIPIPSWGMMDMTGHFFNRISDTTTKFGYMNHPVNMLGLSKEDFATLISDPKVQANRYLQPLIPLGKVPRTNVPISCKAPMCNPYTATFALGIDHDIGGHDGNDGDIIIPMPVSKGVAYKFPFGGNYYYDLDNITVTYGQNLSPLDPFNYPLMFNNDYSRRRELLPREPNVFPRVKRSTMGNSPYNDLYGFNNGYPMGEMLNSESTVFSNMNPNLAGYNPYVNFYTPNNDLSRKELIKSELNASLKPRKKIIGYIPVVAEEVPQEISKSTKVTPEDFQSNDKGPLRRLRRLMKRGAEDNHGLEVKKEKTSEVNSKGSIIKDLESILDQNEDGNSETRTIQGGYVMRKEIVHEENQNTPKKIKLTLEKVIIPVDDFNPPYFPTPMNQGYFNPDNNYYPPPQFRQPIQMDLNQDDQFYGPPLIPGLVWRK